MVKHRNKLPRKVTEPPSFEIHKHRLDRVVNNLLWVVLLDQGVGPDGLQRRLPASATR